MSNPCDKGSITVVWQILGELDSEEKNMKVVGQVGHPWDGATKWDPRRPYLQLQQLRLDGKSSKEGPGSSDTARATVFPTFYHAEESGPASRRSFPQCSAR